MSTSTRRKGADQSIRGMKTVSHMLWRKLPYRQRKRYFNSLTLHRINGSGDAATLLPFPFVGNHMSGHSGKSVIFYTIYRSVR